MAVWSSPVFDRDLTILSYGVDDLNRVEQNSQYLADELNSIGYVTNVTTDYTWDRTKFFKSENELQYLLNITEVKSKLSLPPSTPLVPSDLEDITQQIANDIEEIQKNVYDTILIVIYESNLKRAGTYSAVAGDSIGLI
jgi:hypothetical protein